jgi:serine protease Do
MTNENSIFMSKKFSFANALRIFIITILVIIFITITLFGYVIVNKDSSFSKWIVDNTALKKLIRLNNSQNSTKELTANTFFALNNQNNKYQFSTSDKALTTVEVVDKEIPSVISISVKAGNSSTFNSERIAGTGYVVDKAGLIITNKHVISPECNTTTRDQVKITGVGVDQKTYDLDLVSVDPVEDLAILKVNNPDQTFSPVQFADSNNLKLGTEVIAIGNALGELQNTVTKGIISGLNRNLNQPVEDPCTGVNVYPDNLIQTDAAINQGNSGGPLFDSTGLLIGMNTYGSGGENIGLAIPSNRIIAALNSFQKNGKIIRPKLGVSTQSISPIIKQNNDWIPTDYGEIIYNGRQSAVVPDSAADKVGLKEGDIILEVNKIKLVKNSSSSSPLKSILLGFDVNNEVELTVLKATKTNDGFSYSNPVSVKVTLGGQSFDLPKLVLK